MSVVAATTSLRDWTPEQRTAVRGWRPGRIAGYEGLRQRGSAVAECGSIRATLESAAASLWRAANQFEIERIHVVFVRQSFASETQVNGSVRTLADFQGLEDAVCETAATLERCAFVGRTALLSGGGGI
jgi:hypothetical protein